MPLASGQFKANGNSLNVAAITTPAPLLHDKLAGDTTTGYTNTGAGTVRAVTALIVGLAPIEVSSLDVTAQGTGDSSNTAQLHSSPDGTTWTLRKGIAATMTGAIQRFQQTIVSATVLYWRLTVVATMSDNLTTGTAAIFDYRLFDSGGNEWIYDAGKGRFIRAQTVAVSEYPTQLLLGNSLLLNGSANPRQNLRLGPSLYPSNPDSQFGPIPIIQGGIMLGHGINVDLRTPPTVLTPVTSEIPYPQIQF